MHMAWPNTQANLKLQKNDLNFTKYKSVFIQMQAPREISGTFLRNQNEKHRSIQRPQPASNLYCGTHVINPTYENNLLTDAFIRAAFSSSADRNRVANRNGRILACGRLLAGDRLPSNADRSLLDDVRVKG